MTQTNSKEKPLLDTLAAFLEGLGVSEGGVSNLPFSLATPKLTVPDSIYNLWPAQNSLAPEPKYRIWDPTFTTYTFRYAPPIIDSNFVRQEPEYERACVPIKKYSSYRGRTFIFTPNIDPPIYEAEVSRKLQKPEPSDVDLMERLSLKTRSPNSAQLYDFNGEFQLKIAALESFGKILIYSRYFNI